MARATTQLRRSLAFVISGLVLITGLTLGAASAFAAVTDNCAAETTQNNLKVTPNHGKVFYIDSGQGQRVDAAYASWRDQDDRFGRVQSSLPIIPAAAPFWQ